MFELIVQWSTGDTNVYEYDTREEAVKGASRIGWRLGTKSDGRE